MNVRRIAAVVVAVPMGLVGALWVGGAAAAPAAGGQPPAGVQPASLLSYEVAVESPVMQVTQDDPTASFHPQGEGELTYSEADLTPSHAHALGAPVWPGSVGANAGTLLGVLGYSAIPQLNDPVRAEASSGTSQPTVALNSGASTMQASVAPSNGDVQTAASDVVSGPQAGIGSGQSKSAIDVTAAGRISATSLSVASGFSVGGVIDVGSVTATSSLTSVGGGPPTGTSSLVFGNVTVAGQPSYIDGSGLHPGRPGQPANPEAAGIVNTALAATNIKIAVTSARSVVIAGATYQYGAAVLFFWQPPGDSNHDTLTFSIGGSAISMVATAGAAPAAPPPPPVSVVPTSAPQTPGPTVGVPAVVNAPTPVVSTPSIVVPAPTVTAAPPAPRVAPAVSRTPDRSYGVTAGWVLLLGAATLLGSALLPLVPGLLAAAAPACPRERAFTPSDASQRE